MNKKLTLMAFFSFFLFLQLTAERSFAFANCKDGQQFGCRHIPTQVSLVCGCYAYSGDIIPAVFASQPNQAARQTNQNDAGEDCYASCQGNYECTDRCEANDVSCDSCNGNYDCLGHCH